MSRRKVSENHIRRRLADAQALCDENGASFTSLRREVFELLLRRGAPAKAYDLQADMIATGHRAAPTTVYRALEFLTEQGLVHRINALNAFVACSGDFRHHHHHAPLMLACSGCEKSIEISSPDVGETIRRALEPTGFHFQGNAMEIRGVCESCQEAAK
ncbi:transcriptional repressor [Oxalobacter vibrioformis]|uniref:Ferric uptake regulation protein n=1 Tax=Oxalobacter vibrioformis TaxID=933080 RepID=A0A9E9P3L9_9BURK|nr:Fur family transcriptional regulator [Oxalobacter vibrioformis]WAW10168.1 transcriptional repressor [Oxalobacter vibrioformis]